MDYVQKVACLALGVLFASLLVIKNAEAAPVPEPVFETMGDIVEGMGNTAKSLADSTAWVFYRTDNLIDGKI